MNQELNEQTKRKRKMLLLLPLLLLPFLALAFWALGGGKRENVVVMQEGLNATLPDARIPDEKGMDKMSFYDKAEEGQKEEPDKSGLAKGSEDQWYGKDTGLLEGSSTPGKALNVNVEDFHHNDYGDNSGYSGKGTENKIRERLQALQQQLRASESGSQLNSNQTQYNRSNPTESRVLNETHNETEQGERDPEMDQLGEVMKRIYDVQHPEIVKEQLQRQSAQNRGIVYPVGLIPEENTVSLLQSKTDSLHQFRNDGGNGFYGLENKLIRDTLDDAGIEVVMQEDLTVTNGTTIKMRLLQDIYINGSYLSKGNFIYGTAALNNDRVGVEVHSVLLYGRFFTVQMSVYDLDGLEGIYVPGSISREVVKQSGDNALQSIGIGSLDPSLGAQATAAGIETAKNLLGKKIKLVRVFIKAGYTLLLKNKS